MLSCSEYAAMLESYVRLGHTRFTFPEWKARYTAVVAEDAAENIRRFMQSI